MSKIDELIHEYCPDGAEWKKLGDVCDTVTDYVAAGSFADLKKNVPYLATPDYALLVRTMDIKNGFTSSHPVYISESAFKYLRRVNLDRECIVLPNIGNCGEVYYIDPKKLPYKHNALATNAILLRSTEVMVRYLYYFFLTPLFQKQLEKITSKVGQGKFNKTDLKKLDIPVPPLPVQQEIVRILDSFTALQDELQKELEERKKQFEHVRDQLMNNGSDVILSDVAEYSKGRVSASEMTTENYVGVDNLLQNKAGKVSATFVPAKGNVIRFERNDILIGNIRPYLKKIWLADTNGGTNGDVLCIHVLDSSSVNPRYLYFVLSSDAFFAYDTVNVRSSGKMPRGDKESVMKYSFTLPSLQEQNDIVRKLESMSEYIYDAIPEELSLRQQQYTYYRDKLLSFPRKEA